jgi:uridine kinase
VRVDGRDGAGKTRSADRLAALLNAMGHEVYRAGIDGWHLPAELRYERGRDSAEGYFLDAFDLEASSVNSLTRSNLKQAADADWRNTKSSTNVRLKASGLSRETELCWCSMESSCFGPSC